MLVVGPSNVFMNYIERVLPSLGETSVTLRSLGEVVDGVKATRHDDAVAAAAKGSSRMMPVLRRLASAPQHGEPTEFRYFYKDDVLRLDARQLAAVRRQLLAGLKRNRAYTRAPAALVDALWHQVAGERALEKGETGSSTPSPPTTRSSTSSRPGGRRSTPSSCGARCRTASRELGRRSRLSADELTALKASWADGEPQHRGRPAHRRAALPRRRGAARRRRRR